MADSAAAPSPTTLPPAETPTAATPQAAPVSVPVPSRVFGAAATQEEPNAPAAGDMPDWPEVPDVPEVPAAPDLPAATDVPGVLKGPAVPDIPEVPALASPPPAPTWPDDDVDILLDFDAEPGTSPAKPSGAVLPRAGQAKAKSKRTTSRRSSAKGSKAVPEVSFVRQARRRAFWHKPKVRAGLAATALLLAFTLTGQVLVHQRDRLAAAHPGWVPWLSALCAPLACQLGALEAIDSVVIDSSGLVRLRDNAYRFEVGLRNTSELPLAMPALELSLTNQRNEVVVRRVILPTEWSVPTPQLLPLTTQSLTVQLAMTDPEELHMTGYGAVVFYP